LRAAGPSALSPPSGGDRRPARRLGHCRPRCGARRHRLDCALRRAVANRFHPSDARVPGVSTPPHPRDPAKLAIRPHGHLSFTPNFSADHPGFAAERVGEFVPRSGTTLTYPQGAQALAVTPAGDLYTVLWGRTGREPGAGLARLRAVVRAAYTAALGTSQAP